MSGWDDLEGVTRRISNDDAERLLSGRSASGEDDDFADLDQVFRALRGSAEPAELTALHSVLSAFGAGVVTTQPDLSTARTRPMIKKLLTGKAIATIAAVTLVSAGAAAATGVVPSPFAAPRPIVSTSTDLVDDDATEDGAVELAPAATVGATIVTTQADGDGAKDDRTEADAAQPLAEDTDTSDNQGPDVNGPAKFGLCTAFEARTKHDDDTTTTTEAGATPTAQPVADDGDLPVPFEALQDAADAAGQTVADFCADAVPGGLADRPGKSGDNPSATAPGKPDDNPSATAPGKPNGPPDNPGAGHGPTPPTHP